MTNLFDFTSYRVLIIGGSSGIGFAIADAMLRRGAHALVVARNASRLNLVVDAWKADGLYANPCQADVSTSEGRDTVVASVTNDGAFLDGLIHCAGTNIRKATTEYSIDEYDHIMRTNAEAAFDLPRRLFPQLRAANSPSVVFIGSTAGLTTVPTGAPYAMSKAAMDHLTRYLAVEWAPAGIRVNNIAPWYIRTPLVEAVLSNSEYLARILDRTPMGRIGEAEEVANVALFLCSKAASYVTGQHIAVDGGFLAKGL